METQIKDKMTLDEMRKLIEIDKIERARNASRAIEEALRRYNCELHVVTERDQNGNIVSQQYRTVPL